MKRLKEPSTWAGFAAFLQALKMFVPQYSVYADALTMGAGSVAVALREKGGAVVDVTVQEK